MHEFSITQAILDTALRYAEQAGAKKISALYLRVGALSGLVPDAVQFYFEFVSKGTIAAGARLCFETSAPRARCRACGAERDLSGEGKPAGEWYAQLQSLPPCDCRPSQGNALRAYELAGGFECTLDSIEVE